MPTERFEMRIDSSLLDRLDAWRMRQTDKPTRSEAARRLLEDGINRSPEHASPHLSYGEKLITMLLTQIIKEKKIDTEIDADLLQKIIIGGHIASMDGLLPPLFGQVYPRECFSFVIDVLNMWSFIEAGYRDLSTEDKKYLADKLGIRGKNIYFHGFDSHPPEGNYYAIAKFIIDDWGRFSNFKGRDIDSHCPKAGTYRDMLKLFEPMQKDIFGRSLSLDEMTMLLGKL